MPILRLPFATRSLMIALCMALLLAAELSAQLPLTDDPIDPFDKLELSDEMLANPDGIPREYTGPLRECPEIVSFRERLPELRRSAIEHNLEVLGIEDEEPAVLCFICDRNKGAGDNMSTSTYRHNMGEENERYYGYVRIYAGALISKRMDGDLTMIHEINHAILRAYLKDLYFPLPKWVREGLAVYCAGQMPHRIRVLMGGGLLQARSLADGTKLASNMINGLDAQHEYRDYAESALMIQYLDQHAKGGLPAFIAKLKAGVGYEEAIEDLTAMTLADFVAVSQYAGLQELIEIEGGDYLEIIPLLNAVRNNVKAENDEQRAALSQAIEQALPLTEAAMESDTPAYYAAALCYYIARSYIALGQHQQAADLFGRALKNDELGLSASTLTNIVLRHYCDACIALGQLDKAEELAQRMVWGYEYSERIVTQGESRLEVIKRARAQEEDASKEDASDAPDSPQEEDDNAQDDQE